MQDNIQNDRSVLDLLYADYTFVNPTLARHYGMPAVKGDNNTWVRVDSASKYGRGGILPMAVFMTQYSPGLRTSRSTRPLGGVESAGHRNSAAPAGCSELPSDESKTELPIRQMLEQHHKIRSAPAAISASITWVVFEGYGPVGEARTQDLAGRPIDNSAPFPGGIEAAGLDGLKSFIKAHRQDQFESTISPKSFLAYALNRSLQLSDNSLIDTMRRKLAANGYRFRSLVETIVLSPQFLNRRAGGTVDAPPAPARPIGGKLVKTALGKGISHGPID